MSDLGIKSFGKSDDEPDSDVSDLFEDELETDEVTEEPVLAPSDDDGVAEPEPLDETDNPPEAEEEPAEEEPEHIWANKYRSPEELERAYLEVATGFTKVSQESSQLRQANEQIQGELAQQQQQMNQMVEFLQAQMAEQDPEFAQELQQRAAMQQMVDNQVAQRVEPLEQQLQTSAQGNAQQQRMMAAAQDFYRRHPEVGQSSPEDVAMTQGIVEMMNAGVPIDLGNPEHLDIALEAANNRDLASELMLSPQALQVPGGVARLRDRLGATIAPSEASPAQNGTRAKGPVRQRVEAFVETGSGGAPASAAPGRVPDEFDEAFAEYQKRTSKGVLFGGKTG